jgi:hypothetical protein
LVFALEGASVRGAAGATKLHPKTPENTRSAAMISTAAVWTSHNFPKLPTLAGDLNAIPAQLLAGPGDGRLATRAGE